MNGGTDQLMLLQFTSASLAACTSVTFTNPFDVIKTRRQLELLRGSSGDIAIGGIWRKEGFRALQRGLFPAYIYQILMNGTRFMIYEPVRISLKKSSYLGGGRNDTMCNGISGGIAGVIAASLGSPFNLVKTRVQATTSNSIGTLSVIRSIFKTEGVRGFYHGLWASILRTGIGSAVQLSAFEYMKSKIPTNENRLIIMPITALTSGYLVALVMNPFDVITTRLYNQSHRSNSLLYTSWLDCGRKTIKGEGLYALWKGLVPHFVRIGPHTVLTLMLLDHYRDLLSIYIMD